MCTFSLWRAPCGDDYALVFNRDEKHRRASEERPEGSTSPRGVRCLAPRDPEGGGTWILANAFGLVACVMNDYPSESPRSNAGRLSRGLLPPAVASARSPAEALDELQAFLQGAGGPERFAPFFFFAFGRGGDALCLRWNGLHLGDAPAPDFHTTSSFESERVARARCATRARFARDGATLEALRDFHWLHHEDARAESIRMWRPDACTRSITEVRVAKDSVSMSHQAVDWSQPGGRGPLTEVTL